MSSASGALGSPLEQHAHRRQHEIVFADQPRRSQRERTLQREVSARGMSRERRFLVRLAKEARARRVARLQLGPLRDARLRAGCRDCERAVDPKTAPPCCSVSTITCARSTMVASQQEGARSKSQAHGGAAVLRYRPDDARPFWRDDDTGRRRRQLRRRQRALQRRRRRVERGHAARRGGALPATGLRVPFYLYDDASGASMNATELLAHFANCQHKPWFGKVREQPWFCPRGAESVDGPSLHRLAARPSVARAPRGGGDPRDPAAADVRAPRPGRVRPSVGGDDAPRRARRALEERARDHLV